MDEAMTTPLAFVPSNMFAPTPDTARDASFAFVALKLVANRFVDVAFEVVELPEMITSFGNVYTPLEKLPPCVVMIPVEGL